MDENLIKKESIKTFNINQNLINKLNENNIETIGELCRQSKTDLRNLEFVNKDIHKIEIELQLVGLNLKNNL